jgi:hypothetical protein
MGMHQPFAEGRAKDHPNRLLDVQLAVGERDLTTFIEHERKFPASP